MTPPSPTTLDVRPGPPAVPWTGPRVTAIAVARPTIDVAAVSSHAVEWLPRSSADRRL